MSKKKTRRKAVSYLRVSGKGQIDGDGFPRQRKSITKYAKSHRLEIVEEFRDEGVSGTKSSGERPGLSALLERVIGNGVEVVLVEQANRLARDLIESELILRELAGVGVKVIAAESGTDLSADETDPTLTLIRQVLAAVSQFEKTALVHKLRAARGRIRRRDGRCEGRKPYGATAHERAALKRMKELAKKKRDEKGRSFQEIADILTGEGFPTRLGERWGRSAVYAILNPSKVKKTQQRAKAKAKRKAAKTSTTERTAK